MCLNHIMGKHISMLFDINIRVINYVYFQVYDKIMRDWVFFLMDKPVIGSNMFTSQKDKKSSSKHELLQ